MKDLFSKCDQIRKKLRILSYLPKKSLIESLILLCSVIIFTWPDSAPLTSKYFTFFDNTPLGS